MALAAAATGQALVLIPKPNDFTDPAVKESLTKNIIVDVITK